MAKAKLIFGFHAIQSRMRQQSLSIQEIFIDQDRVDPRMQDLIDLAKDNGIRTRQMERNRLDGMTGNARHQGVVAQINDDPMPYKDIDDILDADFDHPPFLLILDGVSDPHNLGACLRVADAMGVDAVIAPKDRAVGINATVRKVASGAAETVPFLAVTNLARTIKKIKDYGVFVIGTTMDAKGTLHNTKLDGPIAMVLGAEGSGIRRLTAELCDDLITIPMFGTVESMNVSVATGMCLYEIRRQRELLAKK